MSPIWASVSPHMESETVALADAGLSPAEGFQIAESKEGSRGLRWAEARGFSRTSIKSTQHFGEASWAFPQSGRGWVRQREDRIALPKKSGKTVQGAVCQWGRKGAGGQEGLKERSLRTWPWIGAREKFPKRRKY